MNSSVTIFPNSQSQKPATSQNKSTDTELTQLEIDSLRQDLKNSVAKGRQILQSRQKKFNI